MADIKRAAEAGLEKMREGAEKADKYAREKGAEAKSTLKDAEHKAEAKSKEIFDDVAKGVADAADKVTEAVEKVEKKFK